jgi:hypothetical protein
MNLYESVKKNLKEGYSLGDDKESFDVWDEEEKKLEELVKYLKENGIDFSNIDVEHSQDNIDCADFEIRGIPESNINDELERKLDDKYVSGYNVYFKFDDIQLENWGGPVCLIGFYIDGAYRYKSYFKNEVAEIIKIVSKEGEV